MIIVFDIDNTLYDFVAYYAKYFRSAVHVIAKQTGLNEAEIKEELKGIFQKHGTLEYQFLMQESSMFKTTNPDDLKKIQFIMSVAARQVRAKRLKLYDSVKDTLDKLYDADVTCVALTNAPFYQIDMRFKQLGLHKYFHSLFCALGAPPGTDQGEIKYEKVKYQLGRKYNAFSLLSANNVKPSKTGFELIQSHYGSHRNYVSIGDSIGKDLSPAKELGYKTIWAKYGTKLNKDDLDTLLEITPWTETEIQINSQNKGTAYPPDHEIDSLAEIIDLLNIPYQRSLF